MKRRKFLKTAASVAMTAGVAGESLAQLAHERDVSYEPNRPLESTGLSIEDGVKLLKKSEKGNIHPVLRDEILENPNAVFIIYAGVNVERDEKGRWNPVSDQMERFGRRAAELVFRKGTEKKGQTFIKPNMVGGLSESNPVENSHGGIVHPYFTIGLVDGLREIDNMNIAAGARGALRHPQVVKSGLEDLFDVHKLPFIEAHKQYFRDYKKSELVWHKNPEGMVQRKFCTYKPAYLKNTTFINIAHAHTHKVGHTTLAIKNIQGVMPRGYGHICDSWTTTDMLRANLMKHFNRDYRVAIEKTYVKHANMNYRHWDEGGLYKSYKAAGGYKVFSEALNKYRKAKGEERKKAYNRCMDIADTRLFWAEIWAQRMLDIIEVLPPPYINMVEGVFARGAGGIVHADFLTVGRSSVSVDAVTSWLMGQDPREIPYLRIANERSLGQNDIEKIPIFLLSEKGLEKVRDFRTMKRQRLGISAFGGIKNLEPVFF